METQQAVVASSQRRMSGLQHDDERVSLTLQAWPREIAQRMVLQLLFALNSCVLGTMQSPGSSPEADTPVEVDETLERARELYDRGSSFFATAEYAKAVEAFNEAYHLVGQLDDERRAFSARRSLIFNIARSQLGAYGNDRDVVRLRKAKAQIDTYLEIVAPADPEYADGEALAAKIEEALAEAEGPQPAPQAESEVETAPPVAEEASPSPSPAPQVAVSDADESSAGRPLIIGGGVALGLGAGAAGLAAVGAVRAGSAKEAWLAGPTTVERDAAVSDGETANALVMAGAIGAGVLVVTGAVLVALGVKKSKSSDVAVLPLGGKGRVGATVGGRF